MNSIRARFAGLTVLAVSAAASICAAAEHPARLDPQGNPASATAASFDCAKPQGFDETSICSELVLAFIDREINEMYQRLLLHTPPEGRAAIRGAQWAWIHTRHACAQHSCLLASLEVRQRTLSTNLDRLDRALRANVSRVGQCEPTWIDFIGPRLTPVEGEHPDGTSVGYADGVWQVSYDREPEALRSRVGDPVRICLVSKPRNCPSGDDRGRVYSAQNLRTHAQWRLPDASHKCGGA